MDEVKATKPPDVDHVFLDAMAAGLTDGDVQAVDINGNSVKVHYPSASTRIRDRDRERS